MAKNAKANRMNTLTGKDASYGFRLTRAEPL
jgi:hypothetical protein